MHPQAQEIVSLVKNKGPYVINLYASHEDAQSRYGSFFKSKNISMFKGKDVQDIKQKEVSRLASATQAREALNQGNYNSFKNMLPPISKEDMIQIYRQLIK